MWYSIINSNRKEDLKVLGIRQMHKAAPTIAKYAIGAAGGGFCAEAGARAFRATEDYLCGDEAEGKVTGDTTTPATDSVSSDSGSSSTDSVSLDSGSSSTEILAGDASSKVVAQSPSLPDWGIFDLLNPVYWEHSPFLIKTSVDFLVVVFVLTMVCVIVIMSIMWASYWNSTYISFLFGKKRLAIYQLGLISLFIVLVLVLLALLYIGTFASLRNELVGLQAAKISIAALEVNVSELIDLVDKLSKN